MSYLTSVNCNCIPEDLAESELFGHEANTFTGAFRRKYIINALMAADGDITMTAHLLKTPRSNLYRIIKLYEPKGATKFFETYEIPIARKSRQVQPTSEKPSMSQSQPNKPTSDPPIIDEYLQRWIKTFRSSSGAVSDADLEELKNHLEIMDVKKG